MTTDQGDTLRQDPIPYTARMLDQVALPQSAPRRRRTIGLIAASSVVAVAAIATLVILLRNDRGLELEVTSPGETATYINWSGPDDDYAIHEDESVKVPWKTNIDVSASDGVIRLNAGSSSGHWVTCRILRGGVVLDEKKATGMTNCMISVRRAFGADSK